MHEATRSSCSMARALARWAAMLLVMLIATPGLPGALAASTTEPEIVARVNGEAVTRLELHRMLTDPRTRRLYQQENPGTKAAPDEFARWTLRKLILKRLALQEAARQGITVPDQDVEQAVILLKARLKSGKKVQKYLASRGLDEKSLRDMIRTDMLVSRVAAAVVRDARVSDQEVAEYYEAHKADLQMPEEVRLRVIAVKDRAAADEVVAAIQKGADFDRLAEERSTDARADQGKRWLPVTMLPPHLRAAIQSLKPGQISAPVQGSGDVVVARLEERRPARTKTLEEARAEIEKRLLQPKQLDVMQTWLKAQEEKSKIEVLN